MERSIAIVGVIGSSTQEKGLMTMDVLGFLRGNKTFMVAVGLVLYGGQALINKTEVDPNIVAVLLGGGLWTLRLAVKNGSKPKTTPTA